MKNGLLACVCLGALLCPLMTTAQAPISGSRPLIGGHGHNVAAFIAQHDGDGDDSISWSEFEAFRRARFNATDANHDDAVNEDEYVREFQARLRAQRDQERAAQRERARLRFAALDGDHDGKVARAEFDAAGEQTWQRGQRELAGATTASSNDHSGEAKRTDPAARFDHDNVRLSMPSSHSAKGFLALYDGDDDGTVERNEFAQARATQFTDSDRDHDDTLDLNEYLAEYQQRLDRRIATLGQDEDRQVYVRFGVLDRDKNGSLSFVEYQASGRRLFDTADRNHDGVVNAADAMLPAPAREAAG